MASPKELRAGIIEGRAGLQSAFHAAHQTWNTAPPAGEGEESWSPQQVAEHVIGTELRLTSAVSQACGAPALDIPGIDCSSPAEAAAALTRAGALCDNVLRHVSDADLSKTFTGRQGTRSVEELMQILISHAQDHAQQIRAAGA